MAYETITVTSGTNTATAYLQPETTHGGGKRTVTYMVRRGFGEAVLEYFSGGTATPGFGWMWWDQSSVKTGRVYDTVTVAFSDSISYAYPPPGGVPSTTYTARTSTAEVPLETLTNYKTCWNYDLYGYWDGDPLSPTPSTPAWWSTATDLSDADGIPTAGGYFWSKTVPAEPEEGYWLLLEERTKPGVEAALRVRPCVVETKYFSSRSSAMNALQDIGQRIPPDQYSSLAADWLVTDCNVNEQNGYYVSITEYTGADAWDTDLYQ